MEATTEAATKKQLPILVAAFPDEEHLWWAVGALEARKIGRDFIGVLITEDGLHPHGEETLYLVSVLAPRRLHEDIRAAFAEGGALVTGDPKEIAARYGVIPHPGAFEDHDLKLPMGAEYPDTRRRRRKE